MLLRVIWVQELALALASAAEVKVQEEALFICETREGAGMAETTPALNASMDAKEVRILNRSCPINRQYERMWIEASSVQ